jgi:hypothetical protein
MKYYQNKTTNEIIGVENMRQVITHETEGSIKSGFKGYSYMVVYDMVCPNHILSNGIKSFCIHHTFLTKNYKRIKAEIALSKYPEFKQYLHNDIPNVATEERLNILRLQTF